MKKIVKLVLPIFAFAILALSLSACGKIAGSSYKNDADSKLVISFSSTNEFIVYNDGNEMIKGTYKVEKKTITATGKVKTPNGDVEGTFKFEIQDSKKTKLKDEGGGTWTKI